MNWLTSIVIFTILALSGMPRILENQFTVSSDTKTLAGHVSVTSVVDGHPAQQNNIAAGDLLISLNNVKITSASQFVNLTKNLKGQDVNLQWDHNGEIKSSLIKLRSEGDSGYFGASLGQSEKLYSSWSAPVVGHRRPPARRRTRCCYLASACPQCALGRGRRAARRFPAWTMPPVVRAPWGPVVDLTRSERDRRYRVGRFGGVWLRWPVLDPSLDPSLGTGLVRLAALATGRPTHDHLEPVRTHRERSRPG